jgi:hypothetical protein
VCLCIPQIFHFHMVVMSLIFYADCRIKVDDLFFPELLMILHPVCAYSDIVKLIHIPTLRITEHYFQGHTLHYSHQFLVFKDTHCTTLRIHIYTTSTHPSLPLKVCIALHQSSLATQRQINTEELTYNLGL